MQIILDEVDQSYYADVILEPQEIERIRQGETITGKLTFQYRMCFVGIRLQGVWDYGYEEDKKRKESDESHA